MLYGAKTNISQKRLSELSMVKPLCQVSMDKHNTLMKEKNQHGCYGLSPNTHSHPAALNNLLLLPAAQQKRSEAKFGKEQCLELDHACKNPLSRYLHTNLVRI